MRLRKKYCTILIFSTFFPICFLYYSLVNDVQVSPGIGPTKSFDEGQFNSELMSDEQKECFNFSDDIEKSHPQCLAKMQWLKTSWNTHSCYSELGVDGTMCSFRKYLSRIENFCPPRAGDEDPRQTEYAKINTNIDDLFARMSDVPDNYLYIKSRITRLWSSWSHGVAEAERQYPKVFGKRRKLNILVFIGFLANESVIKFAKKSGQGGPLGELLQWSDLLATLSLLGHNIDIATDKGNLRRIVNKYTSYGPCPYDSNGRRQHVDIIFTDIMGLRLFRPHKPYFLANKCRIRLLDSFGTHAEFSSRSYFAAHREELSGKLRKKNPWGGHGLNLGQHWTFYPHSHDNTFLGFVVEMNGTKNTRHQNNTKPKALVYGKERYMWENAEKPIRILKEMTEVHSTVADIVSSSSPLPPSTKGPSTGKDLWPPIFENVINHGFLSGEAIGQLLDDVDIFFGIGFPLEGPAPLEAIAHGAVFINVAFTVPKSRRNDPFLAEKPTLREWSSQCPYTEDIGEPNVITVDVNDEDALRRAIRMAVESKPSPIVTEEFTTRGMLVRVAQLLEKQNYCGGLGRWPPVKALKVVKTNGTDRESCEMACTRQGYVCEPTFFDVINNEEYLNKHLGCSTAIPSTSSPIAPFNCILQSNSQLFSCASRPMKSESDIVRLCPCRDFLYQQHALCTDCLN